MVNHQEENSGNASLEEIIRSFLKPIIHDIFVEEREAEKAKEQEKGRLREVRYYTRDEVCEKLSICRATFHNWKNSGKLPVIKIGSRVYVDAEALDKSLIDGQFKKFTQFRIKPKEEWRQE